MVQRREFEELDDMSIELAVQLDDTRKGADNLTTAFDINTDTTLDVAKSQEKLNTAVTKETKAVNKSTNIINNATDLNSAGADVTKKYNDALQRRIEVEAKLSEQRPIRRYSKKNPELMEKVQKETKPKEAEKPVPVELPESFEEFAKRSIGTLEEMKESYIKSANKNHKSLVDNLNQMRIFKRMSQSDSATARIVGGAVSSSVDKIVSLADSFMSQIPGYDMAKGATKFVAGHVGDTRRARREKRAERAATTDHAIQTAQLRPAFERMQNTDTTTNSKEKSEKETTIIRAKDEKKERTEQRMERDKTDVRHRSLMKWLDGFKTMLITGKIVGLLSSIGSGIVASFMKLGAMLMPVLGSIVGLIGGLLPAVRSLLALAGLLKTMMGGGTPKTPPTHRQPQTGTTVPTDVDTPDKDKDKNKRKPQSGKTPDKPTPKQKGKFSKLGGMLKKGVTAAKGIGIKGAAIGAGKIAARAVPGLGWGLLAYDLYQGASYMYEKYNENKAESATTIEGDVNVESSPKMELHADTDATPSTQVAIHSKQAQVAKKEADIRNVNHQAQLMQQMNTAVVTNNNTNNTFAGGFGFQGDEYRPAINYGATAR
ncbi:MAG: hypothetical protein ACRC3J_05440 [Culicoidibacterales bacterium]